MTANEWKSFVEGNIQAVTLACTSMIASHPEKEKIINLLHALSATHAQPEQGDNPETKHYKDGIRGAVAMIQDGVTTAQHAEKIKSLNPQGKGH